MESQKIDYARHLNISSAVIIQICVISVHDHFFSQPEGTGTHPLAGCPQPLPLKMEGKLSSGSFEPVMIAKYASLL